MRWWFILHATCHQKTQIPFCLPRQTSETQNVSILVLFIFWKNLTSWWSTHKYFAAPSILIEVFLECLSKYNIIRVLWVTFTDDMNPKMHAVHVVNSQVKIDGSTIKMYISFLYKILAEAPGLEFHPEPIGWSFLWIYSRCDICIYENIWIQIK